MVCVVLYFIGFFIWFGLWCRLKCSLDRGMFGGWCVDPVCILGL